MAVSDVEEGGRKMLIRSQNKELLVNFNVSAGIEIEERNTKTVVTSYITGCSYLLGEYSTKEKALKVLDMIQEAYADEKLVDYTTYLQQNEIEKMDDSAILAIRNELMKKAVFQMPEDSEVKV